MHSPWPWKSPLPDGNGDREQHETRAARGDHHPAPKKDGAIMSAAFAAARAETLNTPIPHDKPEPSDASRIRTQRELGRRANVPECLEDISLEDPR